MSVRSMVPDRSDWTRRDELLTAFFDEHRSDPVTVAEVEADNVGGLRLAMSDDVVLEMFPDKSEVEGWSEYWRFFRTGTEADHLVIGPRGVET